MRGEASIVERAGRKLHIEFFTPPGDAAEPTHRPGIVVIHETWGLNDDIRRIARRFAAAGYVVAAPDLFSWAKPKALCLVRTLTGGKGPVLDDLEACRAALAARPDVHADRIGMAGFCFGGGVALLAAARGGVKAAAVQYGEVPKTADELSGVCPIVGSFGGRDKVFGPQGRRLASHLESIGVDHDVRIYDDAGHSFMNHEPGWVEMLAPVMPMHPAYDDGAADDAWRRILTFFAARI